MLRAIILTVAAQLLKEIMREFGLIQPRQSLSNHLDEFQELLQLQAD